MELVLKSRRFYRVKRGQTLLEIARAFGVPPCALASANGLRGEACEGQVLRIPAERRDLYTVRGGESKSLLCGSKENFEKRNGTNRFYIGQTIWL